MSDPTPPEYFLQGVRMSLNMKQQTFHRKTVWLLIQMIDRMQESIRILKEDEKRAVAAADRLTDENIGLLKQIEEMQKPSKVKLPVEVAQALKEHEERGYNNIDLMRLAFSDKAITPFVLHKFAMFYPFDLARALEFGYETEQTGEDMIYWQYLKYRQDGKHDEADFLEGAAEILGHKALAERMYKIPRNLF